MNADRLQFAALYLTRFAGGFGLATLATLLPTYIDLYHPSGLVIGLFTGLKCAGVACRVCASRSTSRR